MVVVGRGVSKSFEEGKPQSSRRTERGSRREAEIRQKVGERLLGGEV